MTLKQNGPECLVAMNHTSRLSMLQIVLVSPKKLVQQHHKGNAVDGGINRIENLSSFGAS